MPSVDTACAILSSLDALGVTHVLYCPGSRSAPFAYALEAGSFGGDARPILDERGAGFAAVGLARAGALPAIVVTSGTAVAELAPAVLEASHARLPLLVLSADRPGELRGVGASQATHQSSFFGMHVRASIDLEPQEASPSLVGHLTRAVAAACGAPSGTPGPVQINVAFRDPLTPVSPSPGDEAGASFAPRPTR
ncbi:MAG: 2-succinyl-5-enolpyruvyl-6-hydroxy-3-cyclohexene-1-carboxylic-acid synthase, partial [Schaalia sp.]|nr:2-succinyl-5-enolpyruvyl-6-hydroxy-3-cyclohexene-1-carboxylic-acid synthase [Schaalia sp.]